MASIDSAAVLLLCLTVGRMAPGDSLDLARLPILEARYRACPGEIAPAVEYARLLHDLRRDKPALLVMLSLPAESLDSGERLFTASMRLFDSDLPGALSTAAPVCLPALAILAGGALPAACMVLSNRGRGRDE